MAHVVWQKMLFRHCDPAGIVFYPRYFEMINDCVESFFDEVLGVPFARLHAGGAVPTAEIRATFRSPGRLGELLRLELDCNRVGRSSLGLELVATCDGAVRFDAACTLVHTDRAGRPAPWPRALGSRLKEQVKGK
ncbi:acyl-CoA thioesterase [Albidovulum sp.]